MTQAEDQLQDGTEEYLQDLIDEFGGEVLFSDVVVNAEADGVDFWAIESFMATRRFAEVFKFSVVDEDAMLSRRE